MPWRPLPHPPIPSRRANAGFLVEWFLISAVASILIIRVYLELSGYPQIGGGGLHIAHMLWGGLLLLLALHLLLIFLARWTLLVAAILGGIGFGTFIDELGKFITSDNNYFFRPTFALIYVIFVVLFLAFRAIERRGDLSASEHLANASSLFAEASLGRRDVAQRDRLLKLLDRCPPDDPLTQALRDAVDRLDWAPPQAPGMHERAADWVRRAYRRAIVSVWLRRAVVVVFAAHAGLFVLISIVLIAADPAATATDLHLSFEDIGLLVTSGLSSALVMVGVVLFRSSRLKAYLWLRRSILVSLLLVQFFAFFTQQLGAVLGLGLDLVLLAALGYLIRQESGIATPVAAAIPERRRPAGVG